MVHPFSGDTDPGYMSWSHQHDNTHHAPASGEKQLLSWKRLLILFVGVCALFAMVGGAGGRSAKPTSSFNVLGTPVLLHLPRTIPTFNNVAMVGHLKPDLDSVAGAIAAAHLFNGTATAPGIVNRETLYALGLFGLPQPIQTADPSLRGKSWVLVDHGSKAQNFLADERVVALIDHHELAEDEIDISRPIYVDIRPWGSMNTVLAFMYSEYEVATPRPIAGIMLAAIMSDTLNLRSPTTTDYDRQAYSKLGEVVGMHSQQQFNEMARGLFTSKSNVTGLAPEQIVQLDFKTFTVDSLTFGWGSGETCTPALYLADDKVQSYLAAVRTVKAKHKLDLMFFSVSDIDPELATPQSVLMLAGQQEKDVARQAFPEAAAYKGSEWLLDVGHRISRKKDFVPPLKATLAATAPTPPVATV